MRKPFAMRVCSIWRGAASIPRSCNIAKCTSTNTHLSRGSRNAAENPSTTPSSWPSMSISMILGKAASPPNITSSPVLTLTVISSFASLSARPRMNCRFSPNCPFIRHPCERPIIPRISNAKPNWQFSNLTFGMPTYMCSRETQGGRGAQRKGQSARTRNRERANAARTCR